MKLALTTSLPTHRFKPAVAVLHSRTRPMTEHHIPVHGGVDCAACPHLRCAGAGLVRLDMKTYRVGWVNSATLRPFLWPCILLFSRTVSAACYKADVTRRAYLTSQLP